MAPESPLPQRVFLVSWWFAKFGGAERHFTELACSLARRGVDVRVFSESPIPRSNQYRRQLAEANIPLWMPRVPTRFADWARSDAGRELHWRLLNYCDRIFRRIGISRAAPPLTGVPPGDPATSLAGNGLGSWLGAAMERAAAHHRPDVIHVHGFRLGHSWVPPWAAQQSIPCVYTEHGTIADWGGPHDPGAERFIGQAGEIACVSERARESLAPYFPGRSIAIHHHIVPPRNPRSETRLAGSLVEPNSRSNVPARRLRIFCIARLTQPKGLDTLLQAASLLGQEALDFEILIAGDGPERASLFALRDQLGLNRVVTFLGELDASAISAHLGNSDLFVLPSRTEALPVSLIEAMASGLPVVATDVGGVAEALRGGAAGLLVPPDSPSLIAQALHRLLTREEDRANFARAAFQAYAEGPYSEEVALNAVLASYRRVASQS